MRPSELDPERWRLIDRLLDAALGTPPDERDAFLTEACAGDERLQADVEALLAAHERSGALFERPAELSARALAAFASPPPNRRVGPFRVERELGRGGMGVVYEAEDTRLGRRVALKVLPPYLGVGPKAKQRFRAEARAVSRLDHPNIATLYEIGETEAGQLYMAFARYEGETLAERIAAGPLSVDEAVSIASDLASGLAAAHEQGIVHRDVKPSNVLLSEDGGVKLLDFGVAKVVGEDITREGIRLGTVAYMSPEQAGGEAVDHRSDLWSLGVVLYEMLTGQPPFRASDPLSLRDAILHEEPPPSASLRTGVPEALEGIVARLLAKDPGDRHADAGELLGDLGALGIRGVHAPRAGTGSASVPRVGRGSATHRSPWWPTRRRPSDARHLRAGVLGLLLLAALVAGAVWLGRGSSGTAAHAEIRRVAVLPLENLIGDGEQQYFVDGIHGGLIAELGKVGGFGVISRTSVMRYRDSETTIPEIGEELDVDAVVEGSVLREGDSLAIAARLIAVRPERQLWAHRYRGSLGDAFVVAADIARSIAAETGVGLSSTERGRLADSRRVDSEAYEAYLRGWHQWERRNREAFDLARSYFRRAIEIDSTFAPAYAGLAQTYNGAADWLLEEPAASYLEARALASRALAIDSAVPEAYLALSAVALNHDWNWEEAERLAARALELNPSNVRALRALGRALGKMGRVAEAQALHDRANELDTEIPGIGAAFASYARWEFDEAIEHARLAETFDEGLWQAPWLICMALSGKKLHDRAIAQCASVAERFGRDNPVPLAGLGFTYARGGRRLEARRVVDELEELTATVYVAPSLPAMIHAALGEHDRAFELLDRAFEERDTFLMKLAYAPFFEPLRSDPRFDALVGRIGLAPRPTPRNEE